ncbi:sec-independent translocase [Mariniluteicoccus flavus]
MFDVGPAELLTLVVLAVILFGPEKLPELARKAARVLHYLRGIANNAQTTLSQELGTDVDLRDLNPRAFVQKHLLDEVQPVIDDVKKDLQAADATLRSEIEDAKSNMAGLDAVPAGRTPFDTEAT